MMNMVLGFDHRATDGAQAGRFLADVKDGSKRSTTRPPSGEPGRRQPRE